MSKIYITKEFTWCMAHMLANHAGKCRNIHGHTYSMQVEIARQDGGVIEHKGFTDHSMVLEFNDVKEIIKQLVVDKLDHAFLYWKDSTDPMEHEIASILRKYERKMVEIDYRPTAEEMAIHFKSEIDQEIKKLGVYVNSLIVWESPTSFAKVIA
ncbi:MAG: 6-carboxytetrahydropterin synthase [Bacteroidota bacterium]|nr:MAG: 6-carboxytetrahydropterin synthase [Bacteroidota bacterium]